MKQVTIRVEGFITVIVENDVKSEDIPVALDVPTKDEVDISPVEDVCDSEITTQEIVMEVNI